MKDNSAIIQVQLPVEAATFLLNEKRADIHKIEQRMGVEVVLIPNIHMETPNYNIVRIRHDDVTEDTARASYKMVELPAETTYITNAAEEAKAVRPEAAVKGITPATSAPITIEKPAAKLETKPSLISRIKSWFSTPAEKIEIKKTEETPRDNNRNRNRNTRNRNERNRNERGDKTATTNPNANRGNEAKNLTQGQQQKQQQPRNELPRDNIPKNEQNRNEPNQSINSVANTAATTATPVEGTTEQRAERSSRRNRNNRRGRRDRDDTTTRETTRPFVPNEEISEQSTSASDVPAVASEKQNKQKQAIAKSANTNVAAENMTESQPAIESDAPKAKADKKSKSAKPAAAESTVKEDMTSMAGETASDHVKADKKRPTRSRKPKAESKPMDLAAMGLQLVETKADTPKATAPVEADKPKTPRKPAAWQKKTKENAAAEPLVMVETQNK